MPTYLDFEKPIAELEARIAELRDTASADAWQRPVRTIAVKSG